MCVADEVVIKVHNFQRGISCLWTVAKLKERLVRMREMLYKVRELPRFSVVQLGFQPGGSKGLRRRQKLRVGRPYNVDNQLPNHYVVLTQLNLTD